MSDDFLEFDRKRRAAEGLRRTHRMTESGPPKRDAPVASSEVGHPLELVRTEEGERYRLNGTWVLVGDVLALYTNTANGWVRGRFEWTGEAADRPRLRMNLWDPAGAPDHDGLPPWVGDLEASLPEGAILRWAQ